MFSHTTKPASHVKICSLGYPQRSHTPQEPQRDFSISGICGWIRVHVIQKERQKEFFIVSTRCHQAMEGLLNVYLTALRYLVNLKTNLEKGPLALET